MKKMNGGLDLEASFLQTKRPMRPVTLLIIIAQLHPPAGRSAELRWIAGTESEVGMGLAITT